VTNFILNLVKMEKSYKSKLIWMTLALLSAAVAAYLI